MNTIAPVVTPPTRLIEALTPEQRLAASRQRLIGYMTQGEEPTSSQGSLGSSEAASQPSQPKNAMMQPLTRTVQAWWRHHPAKMALEIAEPVLDQYAKDKPYQLLGLAAAVGAATILVRPWRLVSVTGLLLATFKSSGLANAALSLVSGYPKKSPRHQEQKRQ